MGPCETFVQVGFPTVDVVGETCSLLSLICFLVVLFDLYVPSVPNAPSVPIVPHSAAILAFCQPLHLQLKRRLTDPRARNHGDLTLSLRAMHEDNHLQR